MRTCWNSVRPYFHCCTRLKKNAMCTIIVEELENNVHLSYVVYFVKVFIYQGWGGSSIIYDLFIWFWHCVIIWPNVTNKWFQEKQNALLKFWVSLLSRNVITIMGFRVESPHLYQYIGMSKNIKSTLWLWDFSLQLRTRWIRKVSFLFSNLLNLKCEGLRHWWGISAVFTRTGLKSEVCFASGSFSHCTCCFLMRCFKNGWKKKKRKNPIKEYK